MQGWKTNGDVQVMHRGAVDHLATNLESSVLSPNPKP